MPAITQHLVSLAALGNAGQPGNRQGRATSPQVCVANISPRERRKRLMAGVIQFAVSLAVLTALVAAGADRWWRLPMVLLFWGAATGFFQWRDKT